MATVNRSDERLVQYENTKNNLINQAQTNYNKVSSGAEQKYNELINATNDYGKQQAELTQAQTNQTIAEINQNKDKAEKDYIKEQKGAYTDYAMQTNAYGTNAEIQASAGLQGSGYSESSRVNMYNTYQNRYMIARESYNQVVLGYNNQIAQAQLQNNAQLAEIAFNTLQTGLQLALEGFQYQNDLLNNLLSQKLSISSTYDNLWQSQYNTLLGEAQFNEQMAYQKQRDAVADSQWQQQFNLSRAKTVGSISSGGNISKGGDNDPTKKSEGLTKGNGLSKNAQSVKSKLLQSQPKQTDNTSALIQYQAWLERARETVGNSSLSPEEKTQIAKELGLQYDVGLTRGSGGGGGSSW